MRAHLDWVVLLGFLVRGHVGTLCGAVTLKDRETACCARLALSAAVAGAAADLVLDFRTGRRSPHAETRELE